MAGPHPFDLVPSKMRALAWRWFEEVWMRGNEAAIHEIIAPHCRIYGVTTEVLVGPEGFLPFWRQGRVNYRDIEIEIDECLVDGNRVAVFVTARSLHLHSFNQVEMSGCATFEVEGGQCIESHHVFDYLSILGRCGAVEDLDAHLALFPLSGEASNDLS